MAGKKKKGEIESLRAEVTSLSEAVWALRDHLTQQAAADAAMTHAVSATPPDADDATRGATAALEQQTHDGTASGYVSIYGYYESGDRGYRWSREESSADELLAVDEELAARLLSALGHRQRLAILKAVLDHPCSATELVERLGLGTTGAAYHHLNVLQAADLIVQESRGTFAFHGHRVPGFLTLLAGVAGILDQEFLPGPFALAVEGVPADDGVA